MSDKDKEEMTTIIFGISVNDKETVKDLAWKARLSVSEYIRIQLLGNK